MLPEFNGRDSFCRNNKLGFSRDENDCDKMSDICKWGRKDGEGKERCMKDEDKILALKQKPKKKRLESLESCDLTGNEYNCKLKPGCEWGIKKGEVDPKCHRSDTGRQNIKTKAEKESELVNKVIADRAARGGKAALPYQRLMEVRKNMLVKGFLSISDFDSEGKIEDKYPKKYNELNYIDMWNGWVLGSNDPSSQVYSNGEEIF